ncbi:MAG: CatB-related O-acetyltransferase [Eubacteriales bacterium]
MKVIKKFKMRMRAAHLRIFKKKECSVSVTACIGENVRLEGNNSVGERAVLENTEIGYGSYIGDHADLTGCRIGRFCSIGPDVKRIKGTHPLNFVSTHPAFYRANHPCGFSFVSQDKAPDYRFACEGVHIVIGSDVWIGTGAFLIDGIRIGNGAVILAGAVVTKDVPDYAVVGGVPAKVLRSRFDEETVRRLQKIGWWDKGIDWIKAHAELFDDAERLLIAVEDDHE